MRRELLVICVIGCFVRSSFGDTIVTTPPEWTGPLAGTVYLLDDGSYKCSGGMFDNSNGAVDFVRSLDDPNTWVPYAANPLAPTFTEANNIIPPLIGNAGSSDLVIKSVPGGFVVKLYLKPVNGGVINGFTGTLHLDYWMPDGSRTQNVTSPIYCGAQSANLTVITSGIFVVPPGTRVIVWVNGCGVFNLMSLFAVLNSDIAWI